MGTQFKGHNSMGARSPSQRRRMTSLLLLDHSTVPIIKQPSPAPAKVEEPNIVEALLSAAPSDPVFRAASQVALCADACNSSQSRAAFAKAALQEKQDLFMK